MAKRKIIRINQDLCDGCGCCISACAEGALQLVDGKAQLVREIFCDGFGDCIGDCPTGALTIEEREADDFDVAATREHLRSTQGETAVQRMDEAAQRHDAGAPAAAGCPGARMRVTAPDPTSCSALRQWPVQIHLLPPEAPFFRGRELAVLATCAPVASAEVHERFIQDRAVAIGCPKLDRTEGYVEKLAGILREPSIPKVQVVRMEVPCCSGLVQIVLQAASLSGRDDLQVEEVVLGVDGRLRETRLLARAPIG